MKVETLAGALYEAMLLSYVGSKLSRKVGDELVQTGHQESEEATGAPA